MKKLFLTGDWVFRLMMLLLFGTLYFAGFLSGSLAILFLILVAVLLFTGIVKALDHKG
ncbi:MAG: hypothetical protein OEX02_02505 [Cyclobacteriaceae bacterium]|nr:hypothetical protein [Cyclobacteriaceae bacterium]